MTTGADDDWRFDRLVDDPCVPVAAKCLDREALHHPGSGSLQQEVIELTSSDGVAHDAGIRRIDERLSDHTRTKCIDRLKGQPGASVLVRIELELWEYVRRQPPGAHFVARETRAVGDDDFPAVLMKDACARRSAGPTADDQRVAIHHPATRGASYGSERVHEGGADPRGMNRI